MNILQNMAEDTKCINIIEKCIKKDDKLLNVFLSLMYI